MCSTASQLSHFSKQCTEECVKVCYVPISIRVFRSPLVWFEPTYTSFVLYAKAQSSSKIRSRPIHAGDISEPYNTYKANELTTIDKGLGLAEKGRGSNSLYLSRKVAGIT